MLNATNSQIPWYNRVKGETLEERVKRVQNVNDPTIVADDVQRWSKRFCYLLLIFTTGLSGFSYYKFFVGSFGVFAIFMATAIAITIEFGKNWGFLKVLRIPFFLGWNHIKSEIHESVMWLGLLLLAAATFGASVYNSTHGAHELATMIGHEKSYSPFAPQTADIDAQIVATQTSMAANRGIKWKGTVTYQAQKTIQKEGSALDRLQNQRSKIIEQQRADWEAENQRKQEQTTFSANSLLLVGGFIELLQFLLIFMRVAAERSLDKVATSRAATQQTGARNYADPAFGQSIPQNGNYSKNSMQFRWNGYGEQSVPQTEQSVPHSPQHPSADPVKNMEVIGSNQILNELRSKLQKDIPNFRNPHAVKSTVSNRISMAFIEAYHAMIMPNFKPSYEVAVKTYQYLAETAFPELNGFGYPFSQDYVFLKRLSDIISTIQPAMDPV